MVLQLLWHAARLHMSWPQLANQMLRSHAASVAIQVNPKAMVQLSSLNKILLFKKQIKTTSNLFSQPALFLVMGAQIKHLISINWRFLVLLVTQNSSLERQQVVLFAESHSKKAARQKNNLKLALL